MQRSFAARARASEKTDVVDGDTAPPCRRHCSQHRTRAAVKGGAGGAGRAATLDREHGRGTRTAQSPSGASRTPRLEPTETPAAKCRERLARVARKPDRWTRADETRIQRYVRRGLGSLSVSARGGH